MRIFSSMKTRDEILPHFSAPKNGKSAMRWVIQVKGDALIRKNTSSNTLNKLIIHLCGRVRSFLFRKMCHINLIKILTNQRKQQMMLWLITLEIFKNFITYGKKDWKDHGGSEPNLNLNFLTQPSPVFIPTSVFGRELLNGNLVKI